MAKLGIKYPFFLSSPSGNPRNQLISKLHLICEQDLLVSKVNLVPSIYGTVADINPFEAIDNDAWTALRLSDHRLSWMRPHSR